MKILKKKNYDGSIRILATNDKKYRLGLIGTVGDLLKDNILDYCDYDVCDWCYIPNGVGNVKFAATRDDLLDIIKAETA